jgi:tryptophan-rich sensory protein
MKNTLLAWDEGVEQIERPRSSAPTFVVMSVWLLIYLLSGSL